MDEVEEAFLLIADISGFTRFMRQKNISLNHAKQIVVRLIKAILKDVDDCLVVAELEGDAVFFYALLDSDQKSIADRISRQMAAFFDAFESEKNDIESLRSCSCDACSQVMSLSLKQVLHVGEVAMERIGQFEKLFGADVILVHRMLKNSSRSAEYVMMTSPAHRVIGDYRDWAKEKRIESFEGVGEVETILFLRSSPATAWKKEHVHSGRKLAWRWEISWNFLLDYLGIRKNKGGFANIPDAGRIS